MTAKLFTLVMILFAQFTWAQIDLSSYDLKPNQIEILRSFEAKGKYSDEWLHNFALAMHKNNKKEETRSRMWLPTYTEDELWATIEWARGGAFAAYADFAGYKFLGESYRNDCPNVGLFRFGRASGTEHIPVDVMREATNQAHFLQVQFSRSKEDFPQVFWEEAVKYGMDKYLVKIATIEAEDSQE